MSQIESFLFSQIAPGLHLDEIARIDAHLLHMQQSFFCSFGTKVNIRYQWYVIAQTA